MNPFLHTIYQNNYKYHRSRVDTLKEKKVPFKIQKRAEIDAGLWEGRLKELEENV